MDKNFIIEGDKLIKYIGNDKNIIIPNNIVIISSNSFRLSNINSISFSNKIKNIEGSAFELCFNLKKVDIPSSIKYIGQGSFCESSLEEIIINGNNVVLDGCFLDCHSLKKVILPKEATIKSDTFAFCDSLEEIILPDSTKIIEEDAFYKCLNLNIKVSYCLIEKFGINVFKGCKSITTNINNDYKTYSYLKLYELISKI